MDLWVAVVNPETMDEDSVGVYTSEELALEVSELASYPYEGAVKYYVLDEVPDWIDSFVAEQIALGEQAAGTELK